MSKQTINIGASPNDGTGTPLRTSFDYTNQNFTEIYTALGGGVALPGATTQVIFNDGGTNLAGDAGLVYNKTTDALTVAGLVTAGSATITGDLTVRTNKLAVTSTGVGCGTTTPALPFVVSNAGAQGFEINPNGTLIAGGVDILSYNRSTSLYKGIGFGAESYLFKVGTASVTDAMTLNSTGLGIGASPSYLLHVAKAQSSQTAIYVDNQQNNAAASSALTLSAYGGNWNLSVPHSATFVNPLIFKFGSTEMMRIDGSGNVGIGVTPSAWRNTQRALQFGAVGCLFSSTTSTGSTCIGRNVYESAAGNYTYIANDEATLYEQGADGKHYWYNAVAGTGTIPFTTAMTLDASGNLSLATGNVVMATSGKGIDFSATAGTGTSELLADYEEGTFLPTVIGTTTAGTVTYPRQLGRYTKVGNLVTVQIYLAWSGGSGTGDLAFGGLPFAIAGNANEYASAAIGQFDNIALTALNVPSIIGSPNATFFNLNQFPVGGGASTGVPYDAAGAIIITSTYIA